MKTDLLQSWGHCWVFQICWHIECSTSTASSFRIWNSSTGIPSPPQALFVVMLSMAHLTSHSRMSGSTLVITSSWLARGITSSLLVLGQHLLSKNWWPFYRNSWLVSLSPYIDHSYHYPGIVQSSNLSSLIASDTSCYLHSIFFGLPSWLLG